MMMDWTELRTLLKRMQHAAEEVLQQDAAFFEVLYALKTEIDGDIRVQSVMRGLREAGQSTFASFVPRIRFRIRTEHGMLSLPQDKEPMQPAIGKLDKDLRAAASTVILNSAHRKELNSIVSEAINCDDTFGEIASKIEEAGYQIVVCLDFSTYTLINGAANTHPPVPGSSAPPASLRLSAFDLKLLKEMKIKTEG